MTEETETKDRGAIEEMGKAAELIQQVAKPVLNIVFAVIPVLINLSAKAYEFYKKLPIVIVKLVIGFIMCFFGGMYPTLFAAIQVRELRKCSYIFIVCFEHYPVL